MTRELPVAEAKREFRAVLDAAERGEETVILRHGKAVAVVAPVPDQQRVLPNPKKPGGLLALAGVMASWDTFEADMAGVVEARQHEIGRPPPDFDG